MEFWLHNVTRARHTRAMRASSPGRVRHTQYVLDMQHRLIPGRPLVITEEELLRNLDGIKDLVAQQVVEVRTPDGRDFDLSTLQPVEAPVETPQPHPLVDNVANDPPTGELFSVLSSPKEAAAGSDTQPAPAPATHAESQVDFGAAFEGAVVSDDEEIADPEEEDLEVAPTPVQSQMQQPAQSFGGKKKKHRR